MIALATADLTGALRASVTLEPVVARAFDFVGMDPRQVPSRVRTIDLLELDARVGLFAVLVLVNLVSFVFSVVMEVSEVGRFNCMCPLLILI